MPKILEISREQILDITKRILQTEGYKKVSIRRVATESGIATGTLYRYFASKDDMIAQAIVTDWRVALEEMGQVSQSYTDFVQGIGEFYRLICTFMDAYRMAFAEFSQAGGSLEALTLRHRMLREQIAAHIVVLAGRAGQPQLVSHADMIAECLLATVNHADLGADKLQNFMQRIIQ